MRLQPPFTETNLQKEECKAYQQADGITAIRGQIQREREINNSSGNRLGDVVLITGSPVLTTVESSTAIKVPIMMLPNTIHL